MLEEFIGEVCKLVNHCFVNLYLVSMSVRLMMSSYIIFMKIVDYLCSTKKFREQYERLLLQYEYFFVTPWTRIYRELFYGSCDHWIYLCNLILAFSYCRVDFCISSLSINAIIIISNLLLFFSPCSVGCSC